VGQSVLAQRARATLAERKALLDDLRRLLLGYLQPLLEPAPAPRSRSPRAR
jgi:hypothetical protein